MVETGEEVVVNIKQNQNKDTGVTTYTYEKEMAGLALELGIDNIDDNGFITMNVNPSVTIQSCAGRFGYEYRRCSAL